MRRVLFAASLACLLAGAAPAARTALPRASADRPDELRGSQVHVIYAVPRDGTDRRLDVTGALESSVASFQRWLATETGGPNLRLDTFQGALDVTFVRLRKTDAQIAARDAFVRDELETLLADAGFAAPKKLYAVYYDGSSTYACGGGAWPPTLPGRVAAMYLHGRPAGSPPCDSNALAVPGAPPGYLDYAMLHEILHTLGFVARCAPHHHKGGHISDRADDILWAGTGSWQVPGHLDPGHDDYYGHGRSDCPDLARSAFLTSNPPPPPKLVAGRLALDTARAGGRFAAKLPVLFDGQRPPTAAVRCTARLASRPLAAVSRSFGRGTAACTWRLPATSRGQRLAGSIRVTTAGQSVSRSFNVGVRSVSSP